MTKRKIIGEVCLAINAAGVGLFLGKLSVLDALTWHWWVIAGILGISFVIAKNNYDKCS